ncbi:MAG: family 20 glycosylhydrolase [Gammaproteobacteria bacterium]|jgi:hypothetical protein|nr:family 20 glycosylhydrolase [Gammaproteobacteria bacterium]
MKEQFESAHCSSKPRFQVAQLLAAALLVLTVCNTGDAKAPNAGGRISSLTGDWLHVGKAQVSAPAELQASFPVAFDRIGRHVDKDSTAMVGIRIERLKDAELRPDLEQQLARPESFWLQVNAEESTVRLVSATDAGAVQGANRLAQLLKLNGGKLQAGELLDWPVLKTRGFHLSLRSVTVPMVKRAIDEASLAGINLWLFQLADAVALYSPAVKARADALRKHELRAIVNYARQSGMRVIPEVKLLSHQEKFFGQEHPELLFNQRTYDPRKEEVYELVYDYLDEVIDIIGPDAIHIGHDEIKGFTKRQRTEMFKPGEVALPAELFLQDVERIHAYLSERNVEVWMWGDMLLGKKEFPGMFARELHGNAEYAALRSRIPKSIVICDWHYVDEQTAFPSLLAFADEGLRVLGSSWRREETISNFSAYVAAHPEQAEGMIATTWFYLQRRQWDVVERIIRVSGTAFWQGS